MKSVTLFPAIRKTVTNPTLTNIKIGNFKPLKKSTVEDIVNGLEVLNGNKLSIEVNNNYIFGAYPGTEDKFIIDTVTGDVAGTLAEKDFNVLDATVIAVCFKNY